MSDIVERLRLRRDPLTDGERAEAADEIEQLRDLLAEALDSEISDYWYVRVREALGR